MKLMASLAPAQAEVEAGVVAKPDQKCSPIDPVLFQNSHS